MPELGVNIDHVATVREARRTVEPDPAWAAVQAELGGADAITLHLREDRRHIQERDVRVLRETLTVRMNLELACASDVLKIATAVRPEQATLVPENREEITTEGGLDLTGQRQRVTEAILQLKGAGIFVSLFLDPEPEQIVVAAELGADAVELHTGQYALASQGPPQQQELGRLTLAATEVRRCGLRLNAGHGLTYRNVRPIANIREMHELNIGHSIVARALMVGMQSAVREMAQLMAI